MLDRAKIQAGAIAGTFSNWFNSPDWDKEKQQSHPQLAGAMQQGSQEAYSTLVQNMLTRSTDPIVKATQEQTKQLVKAWTKKAVGEKYVALMSMPGGM
jgi:DNA-binding FadR family transcriptional regulator